MIVLVNYIEYSSIHTDYLTVYVLDGVSLNNCWALVCRLDDFLLQCDRVSLLI